MLYLKSLVNHICLKPSLYFFVFLVIFTFDRHSRYESGKEGFGTFYTDVREYYAFLPDLFLEHPQPSGTRIEQNRRTLGMAMLYAPAFAIGHVKAKLTGAPDDGYSEPYQWSVRWGSIIYVIIGLFFCRKSLLMFFQEIVVMITLVCTLFATNLFYYTYSWGEFPHSYLFCLYSIFIFCTLKSIRQVKPAYLVYAGFTAGMITLIRPTGILVLLFPLLYNVYSVRDFTARIKYIFLSRGIALLSILLFCLPLAVQMIFWKIHIGQFVYYSYGNERFFFNDPQVINFLFSFRKGWLLYTPMMAFALLGMLVSRRNLKPFFLFNIVFFAITVYVLSSWWEWSYGGSFGCRAMIEYYAFLAFPLAAFISWFWYNGIGDYFVHNLIRLIPVIFFYLLIQLNFLQGLQSRCGIMHWSGMNRETYRLMFLKDEFSDAEIKEIQAKITPPDPEKMMRGERDF